MVSGHSTGSPSDLACILSIYVLPLSRLVPTPSLYSRIPGQLSAILKELPALGSQKLGLKLGCDYKNFSDFLHAKDYYEWGIWNNNESCLYVCV
jgi:hypothetical protein